MSSTGTNRARHRRPLAAAVAVVAACAAGQAGIALASAVFDEPGYTSCTATTLPAPDQNFDTVATTCCVDNAGIPANTTYGVGCVAPIENPPEDYRPTIVMPSRPTPPGEGDDAALDELMKQPPAPPLP
ncbi:hypothetical protein M1247_36165 [Mycobacterium sp. 21AC1]|uniref:hypothetical protein n=1 Tax=[Mycobacterium] appelbergii TaxID=2939269 RepID=UPI002938F022|nr:hypothetical protein [Mycobacterium sp. 21AC1]MDV3130384.1 hypothetical protein [Mycobacterium sp. 21AC1]